MAFLPHEPHILAILFPSYEISLSKDVIYLAHNETKEVCEINNDNTISPHSSAWEASGRELR